MTLQIFLHFFHHKFVTFLQSTSLPQPTAHRRCATNLTTLPLTPSHRYPSQRRIGDALFFRNPIRTERSGGRMGSQPTHTLSASEMRYFPTISAPTARAVTLSVNPRQRRGHTHRRTCAADAPPRTHYCTASTAAPPCGAYLPLHSIPGRAVRG